MVKRWRGRERDHDFSICKTWPLLVQEGQPYTLTYSPSPTNAWLVRQATHNWWQQWRPPTTSVYFFYQAFFIQDHNVSVLETALFRNTGRPINWWPTPHSNRTFLLGRVWRHFPSEKCPYQHRFTNPKYYRMFNVTLVPKCPFTIRHAIFIYRIYKPNLDILSSTVVSVQLCGVLLFSDFPLESKPTFWSWGSKRG